MNILELHTARLYQLNEQGKGPFLRQTKHFEETSELAEAIITGASVGSQLGEAIDGLLMLLSIAADYASEPAFDVAMTSYVNMHLTQSREVAKTMPDHLAGILPFKTLEYIGTLQYITTAVQKYERVGSSDYKGTAERTDITNAIIHSVGKLMAVIVFIVGTKTELIQQLYDAKMDKWERVSK